MILTDSAAAEIRTKGLQSPGQFNKNATPMNWFGDASTMGPIKEFVDRVLRDDETKGLAISASEIPEVALAAASMRLKSEDTNHSIFLLEIITDEINIVRENQRVSTLPAFKRLRDQTFDRALVFSSPDRKWYNASWSFGQAEMFLLNFVPANEIIRASKISDRRPWTIDLVGNPRGTTSLDKTENSRREFQVLEDPDGFYLP